MVFSLNPTSRRFRYKILAVVLVLTAFFYLRPYYASKYRRKFDIYDDSLPYFIPKDPSETAFDPKRCTNFPRKVFKDDVQVVLKTGSSEAREKVPILLDTALACIDDLLIYSDHEDEIRGHPVRDALAALDEGFFERDPKLAYYKRVRAGNWTLTDPDGKDGWHVDKYKFIPMMEYVWRDRPHKKWFVFIETDSYVFWDNMLRHLQHFDPARAHFMASPVWLGLEPPFAHGGTGMVLSAEAMRVLTDGNEKEFGPVGTHQMTYKSLEERCCGDDVLTLVLRARGVFLSGFYPMFNGERLSTMRFNENGAWDVKGWCEPLITLHHVGTDDYAVTHALASKLRDPKRPILHRDIYDTYVHPILEDTKRNWNSMAEDVKIEGQGKDGTRSPEACRLACRLDKKCMQYRFRGGVCTLGHSIRRGNAEKQPMARDEKKKPEGNGDGKKDGKEGESKKEETKLEDLVWHSGWMMDRIHEFEKSARACEAAEWVRPNPRGDCAKCWDRE